MGIMADRLNSMVVKTSSPDGEIAGEYRPKGDTTVRFLGDSFRRYQERELESQLAELAKRWWHGYERGYDLALAEANGGAVERVDPGDGRQVRLQKEKAETVYEGMSAGGRVYFHCIGLREFRVVIRDGTLSQCDESGFAGEVVTGYLALLRDYRSKFKRLRDKHFK